MEKISVTRRIPADVAVVVFGTDRSKKLHASRFGAATAKSAQAAARSMGMRAIRVVTPEQRDIALRLPKGTVSAAGKASVPFVKPALYRQLLAVAGPDGPSPATPSAGQPTGPAKPPAAPTSPPPSKPAPAPAEGAKKAAGSGEGKSDPSGGDTTDLAKGAVVLATDDPAGGWWPATVQFVDGELLTLRWQGEWKDLPTIIRKLSQVAPMPSGKPC